MADGACSDMSYVRVARIVAPLLRTGFAVAVAPRAILAADLGMDSLDRQTLACELDEAFGIDIPDDDVAAWCTLSDVGASVDRLLAHRFAAVLVAARQSIPAHG